MKVFFLTLVLIAVTTLSFAQCQKDVKLTGSKTEYLDANGSVQRTVDENSQIEISKSEIVIIPGNPDRTMRGTIISNNCEWKVPYKEGKSIINGKFVNQNGDTRNAEVIIEGKEGNLTLVMKMDATPDRVIKVTIDSFSEK